MNSIGIEFFVGIFSSIATVGVLWSFKSIREKLRKRYSKITYFRVIRLRFSDRGDAPYYLRRHHTQKNLHTPVYDEVWAMNGSLCNSSAKLDEVKISSSGIVDAIQILPVLSKDADNHPHSKDKPSEFTFSYTEPTDKLAAVGTMVNGIQTEDQWWFGTTAQHDNQNLLLIADFTSLPYNESPVSEPEYEIWRGGKKIDKQQFVDKGRWYSESLNDDIFYLRYLKAQKGDVIKIIYKIDKAKVPSVNSSKPQSSVIEQVDDINSAK